MTKKALVIGINQYAPTSGLVPLRFAEADARELAARLREQCGFATELLVGEHATRDAIEEALLRPERGETFLFFFAGHGQYLNGQYRLHPADSTAGGLRALAFADIARHWQHSFGFGQVFAIVDACRNELRGVRGGAGLDAGSTRDIAAATRGDRWVEVLYGCSEGQCSYEVEEFQHGLLTYSLLEVMRGAAGTLDSQFLAGAAADWMREWCASDPQGRRQQAYRYAQPSLRRRIVLAEAPAPSPAPAPRVTRVSKPPAPAAEPAPQAPGAAVTDPDALFERLASSGPYPVARELRALLGKPDSGSRRARSAATATLQFLDDRAQFLDIERQEREHAGEADRGHHLGQEHDIERSMPVGGAVEGASVGSH